MSKKVVVLAGDGIGPEVTRVAMRVLTSVCERFCIQLETQEFLIGGASIENCGLPLKEEVLAACKSADAIFLGAVGGPKWDVLPKESRPEVALLSLRKELDLFTNLRPIKVLDALVTASSLKPEVIKDTDILIVRELTGGIYFGEPKFSKMVGDEQMAVDTMQYQASEIERIAKVAFEAARLRKKKVSSVDKANILATSQLWRQIVNRVANDYPDVVLEHILVDNCAMQLVRNPRQFDVILTENMFGDILSDEASMLTGSLGMLPSASLGNDIALYEPVHGSAPDIAGQDLANPLAAIASIAMMFRFSFQMDEAAQLIERAIESVLEAGFRTSDISTNGTGFLGTDEVGEKVLNEMDYFFLPYI